MPELKVRSQGRVEEDEREYRTHRRHRYAKAKLDVAIHASPIRLTVENKAAGYKRLSAELRLAGVVRVGIEASGGYERGVIKHLREAGFEVILMQPMQVKAFAKLHLRRAKNDTHGQFSLRRHQMLLVDDHVGLMPELLTQPKTLGTSVREARN